MLKLTYQKWILIAILFLGKEVWQSLQADNISQFAHIAGGICGSLFGFSGFVKSRTTTNNEFDLYS